MLALGWAWGEAYGYDWPDCIAWNLTLGALLTAAGEVGA
jgi:hypothetical protein